MSFLLPAAAGAVVLAVLMHSHQTLKVANASYPVNVPSSTVSVVVAAYDEEQYLNQCLQSVAEQNIVQAYPESFEVIVAVDERSTDATAEVAAANGATVVYSGPGKLTAKETGLQAANGDIVVFLDADEYAAPNVFNLLLSHFFLDPEVVAVGGVSLKQDPAQRVFDTFINTVLTPMLDKKLIGNVSAVRKDAWYASGGYDLAIDQFDRRSMVNEEERAIAWRLADVGKVVVDSEVSVELMRDIAPCKGCASEDVCSSYCAQVKSKARF